MMTRSWMARGLVRPRWRGSKGCRHCLRQTRSVCARERSDEAIHGFASGKMDCFASLAMTGLISESVLLDLLIRRAAACAAAPRNPAGRFGCIRAFGGRCLRHGRGVVLGFGRLGVAMAA